METVNIESIYNIAKERYEKALKSLRSIELRESVEMSAISDVIPGYNASDLDFGSYDGDNYTVLFVDMRGSTERALKYGAKKTFLTMHIYLSALLAVINHYKGHVIDIMGDGIMVFFGGRRDEARNIYKFNAIQNAGLCGLDMIKITNKVINKLIEDNKLGSVIQIGIGIDFGSVVITKIGISNFFDVKAFGDCINIASKFASKGSQTILVTKTIKDEWPKGANGRICISKTNIVKDGYTLKSKS